MILLEIERVVDDAAREAEEGQEHEPCRCYAHRERVPKICPAERPPVAAILAAEAKELLNARQSPFCRDFRPPRPRRPTPGLRANRRAGRAARSSPSYLVRACFRA